MSKPVEQMTIAEICDYCRNHDCRMCKEEHPDLYKLCDQFNERPMDWGLPCNNEDDDTGEDDTDSIDDANDTESLRDEEEREYYNNVLTPQIDSLNRR